MSLDARRRIRLFLLAAGVAALAGCGSRDSTAGEMRFLTPGMSEGPGTPLLFQESKSYVWSDDRY